MLRVTDVKKAFGGQSVLAGLSFQLNPGERAGLVGRNGAGKTTLLRLILGDEEPDTGAISLTPGETLGYLSQDSQLDSGRTLHDELLSVFAAILDLEREQREVERLLSTTAEEARLLALVERHDTLLTAFDRLGGYTIEAEVGKVMDGLGFVPADREKLVDQFSGGWQMRVGLAKLLLQAPDVLLLDEPTNHLDLAAVEWLAEYLRGYKGSIFIVSHDRWLLDRVCTRILELENGAVVPWSGNYSAYLKQKAERLEAQTAAYARQQEYLGKQEAFIARFRGKPSKTRATQSREKLLEKMERVDAPPAAARRLAFRFPATSPSGRETMLLRRVRKGYGDHVVFEGVTFTMERGDRIALIGPNGAGKTTLLRLLAREEQPDRGSVTWGHNVRPAYFTQHQAESLDPTHTVFEEVYEVAPPSWTQTDVRSLLGRFLFRGDDVFKAIDVLSGGERSRVALAKLLLSPTNVLLLDEPTNHLDIPAREVLEEALAGYDGAFVIATHDRYLLDQVTNKVIEVAGGHVTVHNMGYREFVAERSKGPGSAGRGTAKAASVAAAGPRPDAAPDPVQTEAAPSRPGGNGQRSTANGQRPATKVRSDLRTTEQQIEALEQRNEELAQKLADPDLYRHADDYQVVLQEHEEVAAELSLLTARWEELARHVEALTP
jgi:ATP-binding cassette subfamily F protein 3